ncbi:MAG: pentapeptide repeat-containing protein [Saprospiraceae bacterium]
MGNKAALYERMIDFTVERKWAKQGQFNRLEGITSDRGKRRYRAFLHHLALFIFQSQNEYARRSDFKQGGLKKVVDDLQDHLEGQTEQSILKDLLVSFNLRQVRKNFDDHQEQDERNNYAFEFIHKSLQEYLVAELIWKTFTHECLKEDEDGDRLGIEEAAIKLFNLLSPRIITPEIQEYIFELAESETDRFIENPDLYQRLRKIHFHLAEYDFLLHFDAKTNEMLSKNEHVSPLMKQLAVFNGCITVLVSTIECDTYNLKFLSKNETFASKDIINKRLNYSFIHFGNQAHLLTLLQRVQPIKLKMNFQDFSGANLRGINLSGIDLSGADLSGADLSGANLNGCILINANLRGVNLMRVNLIGANLKRADLRGVNLSGADLSGANLRECDLSASYLTEVSFLESELNEANLSGADLLDANLRGANLKRTSLSRAYLRGARFSGINGSNPAKNLDKILHLDLAKNKHLAHWKGTIYEGKFNTE